MGIELVQVIDKHLLVRMVWSDAPPKLRSVSGAPDEHHACPQAQEPLINPAHFLLG